MTPTGESWQHVTHGGAFLGHLTDGSAPRAVWSAAPGDDWPAMVAEAVAATRARGRGALVCVPDQRDVGRVSAALDAALGPDQHAALTADLGPSARYRDFLSVSRGARRVVVGTRAAAFAPVHDLGLLVLWDDGDDLHAEPRAPYPHVREVLGLRAEAEGTAMLLGGFARSTEAAMLLRSGWARELTPDRAVLRARARIDVVPAEDRAVGSRLPRPAFEAIRSGLDPRTGAGADPTRRLRAGSGLRAVSHPGPLRSVRGSSRPARTDPAADLSLVRHGRRALGVP